MTARLTIATTLAAAATAVVAAAGSAANLAPHNCGRVSAAGKTWTVVMTNFSSCAKAKAVVAQAAHQHPVTGPGPKYVGTHQGFRCILGEKPHKPGIFCVSPSGQLVVAAPQS